MFRGGITPVPDGRDIGVQRLERRIEPLHEVADEARGTSPGDRENVVQHQDLAVRDAVVSIHVSAALSGTFDLARNRAASC